MMGVHIIATHNSGGDVTYGKFHRVWSRNSNELKWRNLELSTGSPRMGFCDCKTASTISLSMGGRSGGMQNALGADGGLGHRNGQSRTPVAEPVSGDREPDPERSDQGSTAAFGR